MNSKEIRRQRRARVQAQSRATTQVQKQIPQVPQPEPIVLPLEAAISRTKAAFPRTWTVLFLGMMIGGFLFYIVSVMADKFALAPRLSAQAPVMLDPLNPVSAPITIKNESPYALYEVDYECIQGEGVTATNNRYLLNIFHQTGSSIEKIGIDDSTTVSCADMIYRTLTEVSPIITVDFMVHLSFHPGLVPAFIPYRSERNFRFVATKDKDGKFLIFPQTQIAIPDTGQ